MKQLKFTASVLLLILSLCFCSDSKTDQSSEAEEVKSEENSVNRPANTEESLSKKVYKFDSKVADVSRTLRELTENIKRGAKVTPKINENITRMIEDAKKLREPLFSQTDKMADREFEHFDRDKDWIDDLETEFESLKQLNNTGE